MQNSNSFQKMHFAYFNSLVFSLSQSTYWASVWNGKSTQLGKTSPMKLHKNGHAHAKKKRADDHFFHLVFYTYSGSHRANTIVFRWVAFVPADFIFSKREIEQVNSGQLYFVVKCKCWLLNMVFCAEKM